MLSPVRLSSVTFVCPTQAVQIFFNISTALGTLAIHWHPLKISRRSSQGNPSAGGVKHNGLPSIAISDLSTSISRKRWKIRGKLLLITNRKSYRSFRLVRKSVTLMTLNGVLALFCVISANSSSFRAHCVKVHVRYLISWWVLVLLLLWNRKLGTTRYNKRSKNFDKRPHRRGLLWGI